MIFGTHIIVICHITISSYYLCCVILHYSITKHTTLYYAILYY